MTEFYILILIILSIIGCTISMYNLLSSALQFSRIYSTKYKNLKVINYYRQLETLTLEFKFQRKSYNYTFQNFSYTRINAIFFRMYQFFNPEINLHITKAVLKYFYF